MVTIFNALFNFIASHFEEFLYFGVVFLIALTVIYIVVAIRDTVSQEKAGAFSKKIALTLIISTIALWLAVLGGIMWANMHVPEFKDFYSRIEVDTGWVKEDLYVYMIRGNDLMRIKLNGQGQEIIFKSLDSIRECYFSTDRKFIVIVTFKSLNLLNLKTLKAQSVVDFYDDPQDSKKVISSVRWSFDNQKIFYKIHLWKENFSKEFIYIYEVLNNSSIELKDLGREINSPYWDKQAQDLYFFKEIALNTSVRGYPFEMNIYKLSLMSKNIELVAQLPQENSEKPFWYLESQGVELFTDYEDFSFGRMGEKFNLVSSRGSYLGVDKKDYLYYVYKDWFEKRLFQIPRDINSKKLPFYKNAQKDSKDDPLDKKSFSKSTGQGVFKNNIKRFSLRQAFHKKNIELTDDFIYYADKGEILFDQIQWTPSGKYVVLKHRYWGILVLDPAKLRISTVTNLNIDAFGWSPY